MRTLTLLASLLVLATATQAAPPAPVVARAHAATASYLARVVADPARGAELELLATMLPKGGDLHHHYTGSIYAETYLDWLGRAGRCVHVGSLKVDVLGAPETPEAGGHCAPADEVRGNENLYRLVLMRWSDKDFANHSHDALPPDQQFFDTFGLFGGISGYATHEGLLQLAARARAENVQYVETMLRGVSSPVLPANAKALDALGTSGGGATPEAIDAVLADAFASLEQDPQQQEAVRRWREALATDLAGIDGDGFTLRCQTYATRGGTPSQVFTGLYGAFKAAQGEPKVVGVNLVAPENGVVAMRDYALHMRMVRLLGQRFPGTHVALHAGELAVGMVPPEGLRFHIRAAVEVAGAQRIGHGVDIAQEDDALGLMQEMRRRDVAVEINLTSNAFILGVEGDAHPVALYRRMGVPIVLSTDDAGVSRSTLSHEYAMFMGRYRPGYDELQRVVRNGVRYSFLPEAEKAAQLRELDRRFRVFEAKVAALAVAQGPSR